MSWAVALSRPKHALLLVKSMIPDDFHSAMPSHQKTEEEKQNRPAIDQPRKHPRTSVLHWRDKLVRAKCRNGDSSPFYSVRIERHGKKVRFALETANKSQAASSAAKIYSYLVDYGWEETIAKFKPAQAARATKVQEVGTKPDTVGAFIEVASKHSMARAQSVEEYSKAMRRIVSGVMEFKDNEHTNRNHVGNAAWRKAVESTPLSSLTPAKIQAWRNGYIKNSGRTETKKRKATTTSNSLIRNAKALFFKKLLPFLAEEIDLPTPLPFEGVFMNKQPSHRYHSKIDGREILKASETDLKESQPEVHKILLLALVCGLRVSEIDHLLWEAFDFRARLLRIESTDFHRLKSEDSEGEIDLSDVVAEFFKKNQKLASGVFVIESSRPPGKRAGSRAYRCEPHISALKDWLRSKGVTAEKPIHEMRKEIGSIIANDHGIFAASRYLRHSDIRITSAIYADKKKRITPNII